MERFGRGHDTIGFIVEDVMHLKISTLIDFQFAPVFASLFATFSPSLTSSAQLRCPETGDLAGSHGQLGPSL